MILVDANLLIYAQVSTFQQHEASRHWLDEQLSGAMPVGIPWASVLAFLRLTTNPRMFARPATMAESWQRVEAWLACEQVWIPSPGERHAALLGGCLRAPGMRPNLVPDAHLAALAMEHGLTLCSADADFARFPGLRWLNPLAP